MPAFFMWHIKSIKSISVYLGVQPCLRAYGLFIYKSVREPEDLFFVIWRDRHDKWIIMTLLNANRGFFEDMKYYVVHLL